MLPNIHHEDAGLDAGQTRLCCSRAVLGSPHRFEMEKDVVDLHKYKRMDVRPFQQVSTMHTLEIHAPHDLLLG